MLIPDLALERVVFEEAHLVRFLVAEVLVLSAASASTLIAYHLLFMLGEDRASSNPESVASPYSISTAELREDATVSFSLEDVERRRTPSHMRGVGLKNGSRPSPRTRQVDTGHRSVASASSPSTSSLQLDTSAVDLTGTEADFAEDGDGEADTLSGDDSDGSGYADSDQEEAGVPGSGSGSGGAMTVTFDEKPVVWVDETNVDECMLCPTKFGPFTWKHHCRLCGFVVCNSCSRSVVELRGSLERACDSCVDKTTSRKKLGVDTVVGGVAKLGGKVTRTALKGVTAAATLGRSLKKQLEDEDDEHGFHSRNLDSWLYLLKPFAQEGANLAVGMLKVGIVKAKNLPIMDFRSSDPYCVVYLTQPGGKEKARKTAVKKSNLNPHWNESFRLQVNSTLCALQIDIYDEDVKFDDDFMGSVVVPLADLSHEHHVAKWYSLNLSDELKLRRKAHLERKMKKQKKQKQKGKDAASVSAAAGESNLAMRQLEKEAQILLEFDYSYSKMGEFASHFTVPPPPPPTQEPFEFDKFYAVCWELYENLLPVINMLSAIPGVLWWTNPTTSFLVLAPYVLGCLNPWLFPVYFEVWLIYEIFWQYVYSRWRDKKVYDQDGKEIVDKTKQQLDEVLALEQERKKDRDAQWNGMLSLMANQTMSIGRMTETLQWAQVQIKFVNSTLVWVYGLFQWKDPVVTKAVLGVLIGLLCYSLVFPFRYVALVIGMYVLCMFTASFQVVWWLVMGVVMYVGRSPKPSPPPGEDGEDAAGGKVVANGRTHSQSNGILRTPRALPGVAEEKSENASESAATPKRPSMLRARSLATPRTAASPAAPLARSKTVKALPNSNGSRTPKAKEDGEDKPPPLRKGVSFFSFRSSRD